MQNMTSVTFWLEAVTFLGHVVSKDGISDDPFNISAVLDGRGQRM